MTELYQQACSHLSSGQRALAQQCCLKILQQDSKHAGAHMLLGVIASDLGKLANASEFLEKATRLNSEAPEIWAQLAKVRSLQRKDSEAESAAEKAMSFSTTDAFVLDTVGVVLSRAGRHDRAASIYREAARRNPNHAGYQFNLGAALNFVGDFVGAEEAYEAAIALEPTFYKAHSALASLRKQLPGKNHIYRLEELLDTVDENVDGELHLRHALAKEYEDLEMYEQSFAHLLAGKARKQATLNYDIKDDAGIFAALARAFPPDVDITPAVTSRVDEPIFVVGMPRTGTTLIERILTSHPSVHSAGELQAFGIKLKQESGVRTPRVLDPETIAAARDCNMAAVGKRYCEEGYRVAGLASRFVDKMPLNFLYLGFIHQALPNAKFVCLQRNPLDTVLSNFRQLFAVNFSYYNYAFDLKDTARFYLMFKDIMDRWQTLLPDHLLQVSYEDLVENQEAVTRRLLEHCGLPWDDACMHFEQNSGAVATASAAQVRQPMYRKAVSRWKNYTKELEPARITLEAAGIRIE